MFKRSSGILMHISSLPNVYGIGALSLEAYEFVDFCKMASFSYWQILPLNPTGYGDSPYSSFSTFAGNPYFIDLTELVGKDELSNADLSTQEDNVDYSKIYNNKTALLYKAYLQNYEKFKKQTDEFYSQNIEWLFDYALFMSLKKHFKNVPWQEWDKGIKHREPGEIEKYKKLLKNEIDFQIFCQYLFFSQWQKLKSYANSKGLKIIGDLPIYVSMDSADAWCGKDFLKLSKNLTPKFVAGVPPDYFSKTGQLWGNPVYNWNNLKKSGYAWWIKRILMALKMYDVIRIDHFRGFANYWEIDAKNKDAVEGKWKRGPGIKFFQKVKEELGEIDIIAEDLGIISAGVTALRKKLKLPGMSVLQFGYDVTDKENSYKIENAKKDSVYYIGTHDNDTLSGWYNKLSKANKKYVDSCFELKDSEDINFNIISAVYASKCNLVIITMQDILGLDSNARMNIPAVPFGNWTWRITKEKISEEITLKLKNLAETFNRT